MEDTSRDHLIQLSCLEQGQLVQVVQGHDQSGFEYLRRIKTFDFLEFKLPCFSKTKLLELLQ